MKKLLFITIAPLSVLSLNVALANTAKPQPEPSAPWNEHTGFYAEINGGSNFYAGILPTSEGTFSSAGFQGVGWNANLGYFFTHHFALEGGSMQNYAKLDFDEGDNLSGHLNIPYLTTRFNVPIGDKFSFVAKAGLMAVWATDDENHENTATLVLPFTGIGLSYALTPNLETSVQYQGAVYGVVNLGLVSAGLTYHF
jgi:opacity protein-like surface antigen